MLFEFVATIVAGFGAAGVALLLRKLSGGRLPSWIVPIAVGGAMLGYAIWSEYSWFGRSVAGLPEGVVVVSQGESSAPWRPWTYLAPMTDRFVALDTRSVQTNDAAPDQRIAETYFFARWNPTRRISAVFDCDGLRRAPMVEGLAMDEDGRITDADWVDVPADDPALRAVCGG
jgi:hypothetical protein